MTIIWIAAEGVITEDTPAQFTKFLATYDAKLTTTIEFHSPGGNLAAGLALGRLIRAAGYSTRIGRTISLSDDVTSVYEYKRAICLSACAYAFLGGIDRSFGKNKIYGLHRFGPTTGRDVSGDALSFIARDHAAASRSPA
jgi:hypothetical protein